MKKLIVMLLVLSMVLGLCACSKEEEKPKTVPTAPPVVETTTPTETVQNETTDSNVTEPTTTDAPVTTDVEVEPTVEPTIEPTAEPVEVTNEGIEGYWKLTSAIENGEDIFAEEGFTLADFDNAGIVFGLVASDGNINMLVMESEDLTYDENAIYDPNSESPISYSIENDVLTMTTSSEEDVQIMTFSRMTETEIEIFNNQTEESITVAMLGMLSIDPSLIDGEEDEGSETEVELPEVTGDVDAEAAEILSGLAQVDYTGKTVSYDLLMSLDGAFNVSALGVSEEQLKAAGYESSSLPMIVNMNSVITSDTDTAYSVSTIAGTAMGQDLNQVIDMYSQVKDDTTFTVYTKMEDGQYYVTESKENSIPNVPKFSIDNFSELYILSQDENYVTLQGKVNLESMKDLVANSASGTGANFDTMLGDVNIILVIDKNTNSLYNFIADMTKLMNTSLNGLGEFTSCTLSVTFTSVVDGEYEIPQEVLDSVINK